MTIIIIITTTIFIGLVLSSTAPATEPYARVHCGSSAPKSVSARWPPTRSRGGAKGGEGAMPPFAVPPLAPPYGFHGKIENMD